AWCLAHARVRLQRLLGDGEQLPQPLGIGRARGGAGTLDSAALVLGGPVVGGPVVGGPVVGGLVVGGLVVGVLVVGVLVVGALVVGVLVVGALVVGALGVGTLRGWQRGAKRLQRRRGLLQRRRDQRAVVGVGQRFLLTA